MEEEEFANIKDKIIEAQRAYTDLGSKFYYLQKEIENIIKKIKREKDNEA